MMKRFFLTLCALCATTALWAATATVNGITWTYSVSNGKATIGLGSWGSPAISQSTSGSITIPSSLGGYPVTSIGDWAFYYCERLTSVTIPSSVTSIGEGAFRNCYGLTSVTISEGVTSIANYAFYNCTNLTSVTIPSSVTSIGDYAFEYCSALTSVTIPSSVTSIGNWAFSNCSSLTSVTIPEGVTSIGNSAFSYCESLTSVTIPSSVTSIGNYAFENCSSLTSVTISEGVTSIGESAFRECSGLTFVTIPDGVTSIGESAFRDCSGLTSVTIPSSVTSIGDYAFCFCSGLTSVTIPSSVTSIGNHAFEYCSGLTSLTIPEGVTSIGNYAFSDCSGLTSITIPSSVTSIGYYAFEYCSGLTSVTLSEGLTSIGDGAFSDCSGLTSITIPSSVTSIGERAFDGCSGLTSITIPSSVTSIGDYAFEYCSGLTSVTIPDGVTSIGDYAFRDCSGLTSVTIPSSVTSIGGAAFRGCSGLTSVTILSSVTSIGGCAFMYCSSLTSVTIPSSVTSIGYKAFYYCTGLTSVEFLGVPPSVGANAFYNVTATGTYLSKYASQWEAVISNGKWNGLTMIEVEMTSEITFDANGGEGGEVVTLVCGSTLTAPTVSREGYTFIGWSPEVPSTVPDKDSTYTAQWEINQYTHTFDANGGKGGISVAQDYGTALTAPEVSRIGYTFVGWTPEIPSTVPAANVTYTAQWQVNQYTLYFVANGGEGGTTVTLDYGSELTAPKVSRIGYSLTGWEPEIPSTVPAGNVVYTAQWTVNQYTQTFNANGGEGGAVLIQAYDSALTPPIVTREGCSFTGWTPAVPDTVPAGNLTYTAQWQINQYTQTFDANGGVGGTSVTLDYGSSLTAPTVSREEHIFLGWSPELPSTVPAANTTYTAQWKANQYTITFDANGAEGGTEATLDYGSTLTAPTLVREGYTFTGWSPVLPATVPAANTTYTAQWQINQYTVTFDANGGEGGVSVTQDYGSAITVPEVTREGHIFLGWSPSVPSVVPASDVTYTAQWQDVSYLTYTITNGVATINGLQAGYPAELEIPAAIGEIPVVTIAERAFTGCTALTSVSIPATVTTIGTGAFIACGSPVITVAEANPAYASADGVLFNKEMTTLISAPCVTGSHTLPETVSAIGPSAFENCTGTFTFPAAPIETVGEGAFPAVQGTYRYEYVTEWKAVIADGKWQNLTMRCANPPSFTVTLTAVGGGSVSGGGEQTWEEPVTVTATADEGYVFCGWNTDPITPDAAYTFTMPTEDVTLTAYFAPAAAIQQHVTINNLMSREDAVQDALDKDEVYTKDEMKEMAFGAPIVEVDSEYIEVSVSLQTAETLNAWNPMLLEDFEVIADHENGVVRVRVPKGDKKAAFYKFVVPTEQAK